MAGFVCDICGGQIKMQANKTGVCQNCGMEYDIEAIRAMAGSNISNESTQLVMADKSNAIAEQHRKNNDIDREALTIYLGDLRIMESVINKSRERINLLGEKKNSFQRTIHSCENELKTVMQNRPQNPVQSLGSPKKGIVITSASFLFWCIVIWIFMAYEGDQIQASEPIFIITSFICLLLAIIIPTYQYKKWKSQYDNMERNYQQVHEEWHKKATEAKNNLDKKIKIVEKNNNEIDSVINGINQDISEMNKPLQMAYSLNIIPMQFRNIEGIFYLYDYISTSDQSLSEALMQANLDAIKNSLASIMHDQAEQVILIAQQTEDINAISNKTTYIMQSAMETAANAAMTAKYNEMMSLDIALMKKMQHKQLNYQRADFWLK